MVHRKKKSSPALPPSPMKVPKISSSPALAWTSPRNMRKRQEADAVKSVTRDEIDQYWRMKKMIEEDHLLAAQKAVARIRAKALKLAAERMYRWLDLQEEDYKRFVESMKVMLDNDDGTDEELDGRRHDSHDINKELRIGIKDWWTKSKYAYLNQPAVRSMGPEKSTTYVPQMMASLCHFSPHLHIISPSFGVF